jgi:hypothetical protein
MGIAHEAGWILSGAGWQRGALRAEGKDVNSYTAYGLRIHSSLPLPELIAAQTTTPDVIIRLAKIAPPPSAKATERGPRWATPHEIYLAFEGLGAVLAREGRELISDPAPGVEERMARELILGPGLGVLLHQRGFLVLHASAVAVGGQAVIFMGESGWGKSSVAATLYARGHGLIADDVVPVQTTGYPTVPPAFPQLKVWPGVADYLRDGLPAADVGSDPGKHLLHAGRGFPKSSLPLACVYVLDEGDEVRLEPLRPRDALLELLRHSYAVRLLAATGTAAAHLLQCGELVRRVPVFRLRRPGALAALAEVAQRVEERSAPGREPPA